MNRWHDELLFNVSEAMNNDNHGMGVRYAVACIVAALDEGVPAKDVARAAGLSQREVRQLAVLPLAHPEPPQTKGLVTS